MHIWFDVTAGVAGDMILGSLIDAGADLSVIQTAVDSVIPGAVVIETESVRRAGMRARQLKVSVLEDEPPHRHWREIRELIAAAPLADEIRDRALAAFELLAQAEARVHGIPADSVHFHEVGAFDAIADVVGVSAALFDLGITSISASPVAVGAGRIKAEHGDLPVPVPAVVEMLPGWKLIPSQITDGELATPTGLALIRSLATNCETLSASSVVAAGIGAGTKDFSHRANVVRAFLGECNQPTGQVIQVETNVDDLDPRLWPDIIETIMGLGAYDVWLTPILMKKGRPAHTLSALVTGEILTLVIETIFAHTTTFGVRWFPVQREVMSRHFEETEVFGHPVRVKIGRSSSGTVTKTPEFDDLAKAAHHLGRPIREVWAAVLSQS